MSDGNTSAILDIAKAHFPNVIDSIIAAIILSFILIILKITVKRVSALIANSNQKFARRYIATRFDEYKRIWEITRSPITIVNYAASTNLKLISFMIMGMSGFLYSALNKENISPFVLLSVVTISIIYHYKIEQERNYMIEFDNFRLKTQEDILSFRAKANDDRWLRESWQARFEQQPPF